MKEHFISFERGIIDSRDVLYSPSFCICFFYNAYQAILPFKKMRNNNYIKFIAVIVLLVVINYFFSFWFFRIDLSEDKKYELSSYTKEKLIELNDYLNIDVFLVGDFPFEIRKIRKSLEEKLQELRVYGGQNLTLNYVDLNEDAELAEEYKKQVFDNGNGIKPAYIDILKDDKREIVEIWPGLVLKMGDKTVSIQLLSPSSRDNPYPINQAITNYFTDHIEQNLVVGLDKLIGAKKYHINFLQGHGELTVYSQREIWYYLQKEFQCRHPKYFNNKNCPIQ